MFWTLPASQEHFSGDEPPIPALEIPSAARARRSPPFPPSFRVPPEAARQTPGPPSKGRLSVYKDKFSSGPRRH